MSSYVLVVSCPHRYVRVFHSLGYLIQAQSMIFPSVETTVECECETTALQQAI